MNILGKTGEGLSSQVGGNYHKTFTNYAILAGIERKELFNGISLNYYNLNESSTINPLMVHKNGSSAPSKTYGDKTSIFIPAEVKRSTATNATNSSLSFVFLVYKDAKLFQSPNENTVNSKVISAEIRGQSINGLASPVVTTFTEINSSKELPSVCVWWDMSKSGMCTVSYWVIY